MRSQAINIDNGSCTTRSQRCLTRTEKYVDPRRKTPPFSLWPYESLYVIVDVLSGSTLRTSPEIDSIDVQTDNEGRVQLGILSVPSVWCHV